MSHATPQPVSRATRTARMMMGELMMQAEHWVVVGLPSLIPPRVDQQKFQARLEELIEQAQAEGLNRDALTEAIRRVPNGPLDDTLHGVPGGNERLADAILARLTEGSEAP